MSMYLCYECDRFKDKMDDPPDSHPNNPTELICPECLDERDEDGQ